MVKRYPLVWCAALAGCWLAGSLPGQAKPAPGSFQGTSKSTSKTKGFYAALGLGAVWPQSTSFTSTLPSQNAAPAGSIAGGITGFSGELAVGYDFGAIRTELSGIYSTGQYGGGGSAWDAPALKPFTVNNNATNDIYKTDVFANVYWDINTGSRWTPYVGGGLGWTGLSGPVMQGSSGGSKDLLGYQAKVGVSYSVSPTSDVYLEGVYQGASGFSDASPNGTSRFGAFNSWGAKLGVRLRMGSNSAQAKASAPTPAPAPAPQPLTPQPAATPQPSAGSQPAASSQPAPVRGLW